MRCASSSSARASPKAERSCRSSCTTRLVTTRAPIGASCAIVSVPPVPTTGAATSFLPYAAMGRPQLDHLERALDAVRTGEVRGDLVECGTGRGGGAIFMRAYLDAHELPDRQVWVLDAFRSSPEPDRAPTFTKGGVAAFRADLNIVRDGFERFGLLDDRVRFVQGTGRRHTAGRGHRTDRGPASRSQRRGAVGCGAGAGLPAGVAEGGVVVGRRTRGKRHPSAGRGVPNRARHRQPPRARRRLGGRMDRRRRTAATPGRATGPRRSSTARPTRAGRPDRPLHRGGRLQHASRGGPHPAGAVAQPTRRTSTASPTR